MPFDKITHYVLGLSFLCILLTLVAINAQAQERNTKYSDAAITEVSIAGENPARELIIQQLHAIETRDADLAWSLTTSEFRKKFGSDKEFLSHLRFRQRSLYNHDGFTFLDQQSTEAGLIQKVRMDNRYGDPVTVIYRLEKQDDGRWLIDSFAVLENEADPV